MCFNISFFLQLVPPFCLFARISYALELWFIRIATWEWIWGCNGVASWAFMSEVEKAADQSHKFSVQGQVPWEVKAGALYYPLSDCGKGWDRWELHLFAWITSTLFLMNKFIDLASAVAKLRSRAFKRFRDFTAIWVIIWGVNTFCLALQPNVLEGTF